jgi:hypothetical protein
VGALLDLAGQQRGAPEQAHHQRQEPQQDPHQAPAPVAAAELVGQVTACGYRVGGPVGAALDLDELDLGGRAEAVAQACPIERVVHLQAGRHQERRQGGESQQREQRLLAVLPPDEPDHACTSRRLR